MHFSPILTDVQMAWLEANGYSPHSLIARGKSAGVWLVQKNGMKFAAKCEHEKSYRKQMLEREVLQLKMANEIGIGPQLIDSSAEARIIIMAFIDGVTLHAFIAQCDDKKLLLRVVAELFAQAEKLDRAGIDHGQLGGKLANILVDKKKHVFIIDFEKASYVRKTHNVSQLKHALFGGKTIPSKLLLKMLKVEAAAREWIPQHAADST
ncbi:MAG: hypothetical protein IPJ89_04520 [Candidatus Iainarchaeum archaeon]|uniref:non-specific serine/threonine protein kinase n=1 Tax=Candidatus Iainarchaeum sp. TaxID=3101447 RepID=A0A7T9I1I8_9ARCH|nr:MAG: hypothetical protein IPJ89_04520 [Candidatus Diapherotrites archaeon]